jgi:ribosome-associated protein
MIRVTDDITLLEQEIAESFIRAPGPGGQNVNKVSSAVQLRFNAAKSDALSEEIMKRLRLLAGSRMTKDGVIILTAKSFRSQHKNREDALQRLIELIRKAATLPKKRRPTKPSRTSIKKISESKRRRSDLKKRRNRPEGH